MKKSCKTCAFARWELTKNGKRQFNKGGECKYQFEVPECVVTTKKGIAATSGQTCTLYRNEKYKNWSTYYVFANTKI